MRTFTSTSPFPWTPLGGDVWKRAPWKSLRVYNAPYGLHLLETLQFMGCLHSYINTWEQYFVIEVFEDFGYWGWTRLDFARDENSDSSDLPSFRPPLL